MAIKVEFYNIAPEGAILQQDIGKGVWSSGMILALGDGRAHLVENWHARGPGFNSQLAPFPESGALGVFFALVSWSSWLWHLLNTQNVPSSILGEIIFCLLFSLLALSNYIWPPKFFPLDISALPLR